MHVLRFNFIGTHIYWPYQYVIQGTNEFAFRELINSGGIKGAHSILPDRYSFWLCLVDVHSMHYH